MRRTLTALIAAVWLPAAAAGAQDFVDDEAFFEFLGSFSDDEGNWLDPLEIEQMAVSAELANSKAVAGRRAAFEDVNQERSDYIDRDYDGTTGHDDQADDDQTTSGKEDERDDTTQELWRDDDGVDNE